jgi:hypothetical protein
MKGPRKGAFPLERTLPSQARPVVKGQMCGEALLSGKVNPADCTPYRFFQSVRTTMAQSPSCPPMRIAAMPNTGIAGASIGPVGLGSSWITARFTAPL